MRVSAISGLVEPTHRSQRKFISKRIKWLPTATGRVVRWNITIAGSRCEKIFSSIE